MKPEQFLIDIGLGRLLTKSEPTTTNVVSFVSPNSNLMDNPRDAVYKHIKNLILTYGEDVVLEAVDVATKV